MARDLRKLARIEATVAAQTKVVPKPEGEAEVTITPLQVLRRELLTPCATKEAFQAWLIRWLNLDFPDQQVDSDSTGAPLEELWRIYHAMVTNDKSFPRRHLLYAARACYKTLAVSVLELLGTLHGDRNVIHLAAIEQQASKAQEYLRGFLSREGLSEFSVGNNKRSVAVVWARHKKTGDIVTNVEWRAMDQVARRDYVYHVHYAMVIVNTAQSSNSGHTALFVVDELDVIRFPLAYDEAKLIPETQVSVDGVEQPPITVLTSSRKFSGGLVQREIDEAETTGTSIRHWNILDVARRCPDSKHQPDLPKADVFIANDGLRVLKPDEYQRVMDVDSKKAADYKPFKVFQGCLDNCPERVCAGCKGVLAGVTSKARMLKDVDDVVGKFREVSVEMAQAQLLCWKPGNESGVYKHFDRKKHCLSLSDMWETITGERHPRLTELTKQVLIDMLISRRVKWVAALDWGYTHNFAVILAAVDGRRAFIVDAWEVAQLELNQKIEICNRRIKKYDPVCWPDPAYPSDIKSFRMKGYKMYTHTKDVLGGINAVRNKLSPPNSGEPELFMLKDDAAGDLVARRIESYKWKLDAQGRPTDEPDDFEDDLCDALRYLIQNEFRRAGKVVVGKDKAPDLAPSGVRLMPKTWMAEKIGELTGGECSAIAPTKKVRKGFFSADFS